MQVYMEVKNCRNVPDYKLFFLYMVTLCYYDFFILELQLYNKKIVVQICTSCY